MFTGFNFETTNFDFSRFRDKGEQLLRANKTQVKETLDAFLLKDGSVDGSAMQKNWFPQIDADIFISHSHHDEDQALGLAAVLNHIFGLRVFIDSCVWGYANDLLRQIDDEYCRNTSGATYNYDKRNYSTSHIHMMLATALAMMIDDTECVIFLKSPNSITSKDVINNRTVSPWIYHELNITRLIQKKSPKFHREKTTKLKAVFSEDSLEKSLTVSYVADLGHFHPLHDVDLDNWVAAHEGDRTVHALDHLYALKQIPVKPLDEVIFG